MQCTFQTNTFLSVTYLHEGRRSFITDFDSSLGGGPIHGTVTTSLLVMGLTLSLIPKLTSSTEPVITPLRGCAHFPFELHCIALWAMSRLWHGCHKPWGLSHTLEHLA